MIDYHIHPGFSIDAEEYSIDDYCRRAVEIGLREICFTPHYEFDPLRKEIDWWVRYNGRVMSIEEDWLPYFIEEVRRAAESYAPFGLTVKAGLEVGFDLGLEEPIARVVEAHPFDFIIGSVHCIDHVAISSAGESAPYYAAQTLERVAELYFTTLRQAVASGLFDVVGHLDIYRRHGYKFYGPDVLKAHRSYLGEVLKVMAEKNTGLEVNTSSARHNHREFYPSREILEAARDAGIRVFTVGSDAHLVGELGQGVAAGLAVLAELGLKASVFTRRAPGTVEMPGR
ncbi:MAG: histidinol-phosphatase [Bacillota bacterium]